MLNILDSSAIRFAQETERRRIARELHDGVVQSLTVLVADLEYFRTRCLPTIDQANCEVAERVATWQQLARDSLTCIRQALGELHSPAELDLGLQEEQNTDKGQCNDGLTARELEMLVLLARGMLAKEISRTLAISEKTVRNHISSIYRKLNIFDRSQLVIYAMRNGLIDIDDRK